MHMQKTAHAFKLCTMCGTHWMFPCIYLNSENKKLKWSYIAKLFQSTILQCQHFPMGGVGKPFDTIK